MNTRRSFLLSSLTLGAALSASGLIKPAFAAASDAESNQALIVLYSWSGNTLFIGQQIQKRTGAELIELELAEPYSGDYTTCTRQAVRDRESDARPKLTNNLERVLRFRRIYLGYPNWGSTIPMPIASLLESSSFNGKTIHPFCSHGGGGLGRSISHIRQLAPQAIVGEPFSVHGRGGASVIGQLDSWLDRTSTT